MNDRIFGDQTIYHWFEGGLTIDTTDSRIVVPLTLNNGIDAQFALNGQEADELACVLNSGVDMLDGKDLPASELTWGESVSKTNGRILIPINQGGKYIDDIELNPAQAAVLADMLRSAAGGE